MAQLVKLLDYISRYESNPFHYPSQYIRLKQENWRKLNIAWENENTTLPKQTVPAKEYPEKDGFKWNPFKKEVKQEKEMEWTEEPSLPETKKQLTQFYLNQLYPLQLKWATSTITHESFTDRNFQFDETLKFFLQRFPDIYLLMYYPIFNVKKAPIDGEIIMISPIGIEVIALMNKNPDATIVATNDRTWTIEEDHSQQKIISPFISLKRTEQIVKSILQAHSIDFTVNKTILSQNNHILYSAAPYQTNIIGKRDFETWLKAKRDLSSPLKSIQLKAMEALLHHCQTTSVRRPEWEKEEPNFTTEDVEDK